MGEVLIWLVGSIITVVVCAIGAWFPIHFLTVVGIFCFWAVVVWGGWAIFFVDFSDFIDW